MDILEVEKRKLEIEKRLLEIIKHRYRSKFNKKQTMKEVIELYQEYLQLDVYTHRRVPEYMENDYSNFNCYYYALDLKIPEIFIKCIKIIFNKDMISNSVGFISKGYSFQYEELSVQSLLNDFANDLDYLNIGMFETDFFKECEHDGYKVAIYIDKYNTDYHFLRENNDGIWSSKWGFFSNPEIIVPKKYIAGPTNFFEFVNIYEIVKPTTKKLSK